MVPERAVGTQQGQKFVFVLNDKNLVEQRPVKLGMLKDSLRVVKEGVTVKDRIVIAAMARVRPGMAVDPKMIELEVPASLQNEKKAIERMNAVEPSSAAKAIATTAPVAEAPPKPEPAKSESPAPKP